MATSPSTQYCSNNSLERFGERGESVSTSWPSSKSFENEFQPDFIFPSDDDDASNACAAEPYFFPSEDSNQSRNQFQVADADDDKDGGSGAEDCYHFPSEESDQDDFSNGTEEDEDCADEELGKIGRLLVGKCCDRGCLRHLTATDVITSRKNYSHLSKAEQRKYLFTKLKENSSEMLDETNSQDIKRFETNYFIAGKEICSVAWSKIFSISLRTLTRMLRKICSGETAHGNQGKRRANTKKESAAVWMEKYFNLIGDKMPNSSQIHLPSWETQKDIHVRYCQDMHLQGIEQDEVAGLSSFYKIWTEKFSHVIIPEVWLLIAARTYSYVFIYLLFIAKPLRKMRYLCKNKTGKEKLP